jgi:para-aminobenzoate synthetase component I
MDRSLFHRVYDAGHLIEEVPFCDPVALFAPLAADPFALFLDSATAAPENDPSRQGRWSYIAADPFATLVKSDEVAFLNNINVGKSGFDLLDRQLSGLSLPPGWTDDPALPPFAGGLAGFLGYELGHELEALPARKPWGHTSTEPPDMALGAYDCVIAFDNIDRRAFIVSTGLPEVTPAARAVRAEARATKWRARLALSPALPPLQWPETPSPDNVIVHDTQRTEYEPLVARTVELIHAGDIFQANLSQRFKANLQNGDDAFTLYRRLRALSPAPFAGFFNFKEGALLSSSPERFLKADGRHIETKPIKGTRPRGQTPQEDQILADELLSSEKDRAENTMIVDLLRNDLSRVSDNGSVQVPSLCELESFATVHHLVSTVTANLKNDKNIVDLLRSCFPGGSITGAPKIRAMEIISELEQRARGPYCGTLGFLSFDGKMDTNISIRTLTVMNGQAVFQAGGGIVADSVPADEFDETLTKAAALTKAIRGERPADDEMANKVRA